MSLSLDIGGLSTSALSSARSTSILQQSFSSFGSQSSSASLSQLLYSGATQNITSAFSSNLSSLAGYVSSENRLSSDYNLLANLGGFENYATTLNLLEVSHSSLQGQFDDLVAELGLEV